MTDETETLLSFSSLSYLVLVVIVVWTLIRFGSRMRDVIIPVQMTQLPFIVAVVVSAVIALTLPVIVHWAKRRVVES